MCVVPAESRASRHSVSEPREPAEDGAGEKLLSKAEEARIVSVEMADAKYVVGDHRNGDAKIEIDAHKRTFSGLTKEELLKYQDDPFWVRLRWLMFVLFWALWLCMLAGAIVIIVQAPKCAAPLEWHKRGPLVELDAEASAPAVLAARLPLLAAARARGAYAAAATLAGGDLYDAAADLGPFRALADHAKKENIKIIVDMEPNFVNTSHEWFVRSESSETNYTDYFVWADKNTSNPGNLPNNWRSTTNEPAWSWSDTRQKYYLQQYGSGTADLNFGEERVVAHLDAVFERWLDAGAYGFRLNKTRQLLVRASLKDNPQSTKAGATHDEYAYYKPLHTSDQPGLAALLARWRALVRARNPEAILTLAEHIPAEAPYTEVTSDGKRFLVDLPSAGAADLALPAADLADRINALLPHWPALQLKTSAGNELEAGVVSALLPATPLLTWRQIYTLNGTQWTMDPAYASAVVLRGEPVVANGNYSVAAIANGTLLACTRWLPDVKSFVALWNPTAAAARGEAAAAAVAGSAPVAGMAPVAVPAHLEVAALSRNYQVDGINVKDLLDGANVTVSPRSAIILSFTPIAQK